MGQIVTYRINYAKAIEALTWLANEKPGIDIYHIAKVLYYAEKRHINKYARPIIGDTYISMDYGQVPSGVRDLISKNSWLDPDDIKKFSKSVTVKKNPNPNIIPLRKPQLKYFSDTDIACLKEALSECGNLTFKQLKNKSHEEESWIHTERNQPIDYLLMIDKDNPNKKEIIEEIKMTVRYASF